MVYGEFVLSPQVKLAQLLAENLGKLDSVFFTNSGTEATEGAMKLAKRATGRAEIFACRNAYHGSTQGAASLMSPTDFTLAFQPLLPGIRHLEFNEMLDLQQVTTRTAAVVVETVQAESGIRPPKSEWLKTLRSRCDEVGALLILDEIQAGCGRTGSLFAFQKFGIEPDVLLLAKGFGGGMPIGCFVAPRDLMRTLSFDPVLGNITTFGGHPVAAAAALATMQILTTSDLISEVAAKEILFLKLLKHNSIREIRHAGLWLAVDLGDAARVQSTIQKCLGKGLLTDWFLFNDRSLRIAPPLTISLEEIEWACSVLLDCF